MPDISDKEKYLIRLISKKYCKILSCLNFKHGILIYEKTYNILYKKSARWKFCLMCGQIDYSEEMLLPKHECPSLLVLKYPLCCSTSWIQLKDFFLSDKYLSTLSEVGLEIIKEET